MNRYDEILKNIRSSIADLESKGIIVKPLTESFEELLQHTENVQKIESDLDAVRQEVISPIRKELLENKKAGKFSILGFYVGALGFFASIVGVAFPIIDFNAKLKETLSTTQSAYETRIQEYERTVQDLQGSNEKLLKENRKLIETSGIGREALIELREDLENDLQRLQLEFELEMSGEQGRPPGYGPRAHRIRVQIDATRARLDEIRKLLHADTDRAVQR